MQNYSKMRQRVVFNDGCLNDWLLANVLESEGLSVGSYPVVASGRFASQVGGGDGEFGI